MANERQQEQQQTQQQDRQQERQAGSAQAEAPPAGEHHPSDDTDGLAGKKAEELTPEELRLMADTMPGEGPGD